MLTAYANNIFSLCTNIFVCQMSRKRSRLSFAAATMSPFKVHDAKVLSDPLCDTVFIQAGNYMVYPRKQQVFVRPTAHGLMPLVRTMHNLLCDKSAAWRCTIPLSVFAYYCAVMFWRRLVDACNTRTHTVKTSLIKFRKLLDDTWAVPTPLDKYLAGIGSFRSPTGVPIHIQPEWPSEETLGGLPGWYGRIGADTHVHYEDFVVVPAAVYSIVACLDPTIADGGWPTLPHGVVPEACILGGQADYGQPTDQFIGLCRKQPLTDEALQLLHDCGVRAPSMMAADYAGCFNYDASANIIPVNEALMTAVSELLLDECTHVYDMLTDVNRDSQGSMAQAAWVQPMVPNPLCRRAPDPPVSALVEGALTVRVSDKLDGRLVTAAMNFVYRYRKEPTLTVDGQPAHTWSCWSWLMMRRLPAGWNETRNYNFDYDQRAMFINFHGFETQVYSLANSLRHLCRVMITKAPKPRPPKPTTVEIEEQNKNGDETVALPVESGESRDEATTSDTTPTTDDTTTNVEGQNHVQHEQQQEFTEHRTTTDATSMLIDAAALVSAGEVAVEFVTINTQQTVGDTPPTQTNIEHLRMFDGTHGTTVISDIRHDSATANGQ